MPTLKENVIAKHNRFAQEHRTNDRSGWQVTLGYGDYLNYGYWTEDTKTGAEASEAMLERLLAKIPDKSGLILDVACGLGATSRYLARYYPPEKIIGINIADDQIRHCAEKLPGARFEVMRAEALAFEDGGVDDIISIEAAFHFETRLDFLKEAHRVLKPGGRLLLSDIFTDRDHPLQPAENRVADLDAYREVYRAAGFERVEVEDATGPCVRGMTDAVWRAIRRLQAAGKVTDEFVESTKRSLVARRNVLTYVLVCAQKS
ncbi:MAG: methyltransferase domain-containing protein [Pseudomonadota bacterium]